MDTFYIRHIIGTVIAASRGGKERSRCTGEEGRGVWRCCCGGDSGRGGGYGHGGRSAWFLSPTVALIAGQEVRLI